MIREATPAQRRSSRRGGARYAVTSVAAAIDACPLAGLFAVYAPAGPSIRVYYCEPLTGRCSCGALSAACAHISATTPLIGRWTERRHRRTQ